MLRCMCWTHSLHYGLAVFEGACVSDARWAYSDFPFTSAYRASIKLRQNFSIKLYLYFDELVQAQKDVVRLNNLASAYIRPLIWVGSEKLGIAAKDNTIHAAIAAWHWGAYLGEEGIKKGIRVKTSSYTHHHPNITMCKAKAASNYPVSILANQEVTRNGYDEAILMDPQGFVCQGSGENLFWSKMASYIPLTYQAVRSMALHAARLLSLPKIWALRSSSVVLLVMSFIWQMRCL